MPCERWNAPTVPRAELCGAFAIIALFEVRAFAAGAHVDAGRAAGPLRGAGGWCELVSSFAHPAMSTMRLVGLAMKADLLVSNRRARRIAEAEHVAYAVLLRF